MFRKFFAALSNLSAAADALADSFREANMRLRGNLNLDEPAELPQLELQESPKERKVKR